MKYWCWLLFRECCSHCRFQPYDCIIICFVGYIQSTFKCRKWAHVDNVVHGLSLATITGRWLGETTFVQVSTTWALTCPEMVHQRPCMTREMETWLSDSRVGNNSVVEHRSWRPVLSPLRKCVDRCHVWPYWALRCKMMCDDGNDCSGLVCKELQFMYIYICVCLCVCACVRACVCVRACACALLCVMNADLLAVSNLKASLSLEVKRIHILQLWSCM